MITVGSESIRNVKKVTELQKQTDPNYLNCEHLEW